MGEIFASYLADKTQISRICRELKKKTQSPSNQQCNEEVDTWIE
jgi:hypothetical protein